MEQYNNQNMERELGWEDEIVNDGQEYIDIPDGEYDFLVESIDLGRFQGSAKIPSCKQVKITLVIEVPGIGPASISTNLILHSILEWKVSEFFASIGLKQKGTPFKMRWNIQGAKGRCKISHRMHDGKTYNDVKRFIPMWEIQEQQMKQQSTNNQSYGGYKPGQF